MEIWNPKYFNTKPSQVFVLELDVEIVSELVAAARESKPKQEKRLTQTHFREAIAEIIEANKAASKQQVTLTPVEGDVPLPTPPTNLSIEQTSSQQSQ